MNHLFIARHGLEDECTGELEPEGVLQIEKLGEFIEKRFSNCSKYLASSNQPRALQSLEVLRKKLSDIIGYERYSVLFLEEFNDGVDNVPIDNIINGGEPHVEIIGLITHLPVIEVYPISFMRRRFTGYSEKMLEEYSQRLKHIDNGEGVLIDMQSGSFQLIP